MSKSSYCWASHRKDSHINKFLTSGKWNLIKKKKIRRMTAVERRPGIFLRSFGWFTTDLPSEQRVSSYVTKNAEIIPSPYTITQWTSHKRTRDNSAYIDLVYRASRKVSLFSFLVGWAPLFFFGSFNWLKKTTSRLEGKENLIYRWRVLKHI